MRRTLLTLLVVAASFGAATGAWGAAFPDRIDLPDGWQPEGIAAGDRNTLYVGSLATGAVWKVNARTGKGQEAVPGADGRVAAGLKIDNRDRLFVAGGATGKLFVYDADDGSLLKEFTPGTPGSTFINDVTLTRRGAYFTDSRRQVIYFVDRKLSAVIEIDVTEIPVVGQFNLNGIADSANGKTLLAVQTEAGKLWRINVRTGVATEVDLHGASLESGDGLLLVGNRLWVVQNQLDQIAVVKLNRKLTSGRVLRTITSDAFEFPTTLARLGSRLYAVNARFNIQSPTPDTDYWITKVKR
jgi:sugar lactone lactonase YvrE